MDPSAERGILLDLFESTGIGLVGLDAEDRIVHANPNVGTYLDLDPAALLGREVRVLEPQLRSAEFWSAFPGTFYCLCPAPHALMLTICRSFEPRPGSGMRRAIILRPYSLEREFGRMRICLNNYLAHEIASHLSSIGIASEFITEPELRESRETRAAFIATFRHDVTDLNTLFVQLLEAAEPLVLPSRVAWAPLDWKALVEDLAAKTRGLANDRSVALTCSLPPQLPAPSGDFHWLYFALFGVLSHALQSASSLSEVTLAVRHGGGRIETAVGLASEEVLTGTWPPPALFPLAEARPRIGRLQISELAVARGIFLLHGGDLRLDERAGRTAFTAVLPA
jgi:signal transduction histidine kinase